MSIWPMRRSLGAFQTYVELLPSAAPAENQEVEVSPSTAFPASKVCPPTGPAVDDTETAPCAETFFGAAVVVGASVVAAGLVVVVVVVVVVAAAPGNVVGTSRAPVVPTGRENGWPVVTSTRVSAAIGFAEGRIAVTADALKPGQPSPWSSGVPLAAGIWSAGRSGLPQK